jgi:hypothetical protein
MNMQDSRCPTFPHKFNIVFHISDVYWMHIESTFNVLKLINDIEYIDTTYGGNVMEMYPYYAADIPMWTSQWMTRRVAMLRKPGGQARKTRCYTHTSGMEQYLGISTCILMFQYIFNILHAMSSILNMCPVY